MGNFNIIDFIKLIQINKRKYIITLSVVFLFSTIIVFSMYNYYTSTQTLAPELSSSSSLLGGLGRLSSLAGIDINSINGNEMDAISPDVYSEVIHSTPFIQDLSKIQIETLDGDIKTTLFDYFDTKQKFPWYAAIPKAIFSTFNKKDITGGLERNNSSIISEKESSILESISNSINLNIDNTTGLIYISVTMQDPFVASCIADSVSERLQKYIYNYRTKKSSLDLSYYQSLCAKSKQEYLKVAKEYATFVDGNQNLFMTQYKTKETFLENEMNLKYQEYSQLKQQVTMAQAKLQSKVPAYNIVQPAIVPTKKSGPHRVGTILILEFLAFCILSVFILIKDTLHNK